MTIQQAKTNIILWFAKNDTFCIKKDFINSLAEAQTYFPENEEIEKKIYLCALKSFEKTGVCKKLHSDNSEWQEDVWALEKKLAEFPQNVTISFSTANAIGEILDKCYKIQNIKREKTPIYAISEHEIQEVCIICLKLLNEVIERNDNE